MADFALWATACETAFRPSGTFIAAYERNRSEAVENTIEGDPVASAVKTLAEQVLAFDDTVDEFKRQIILDAQQAVASGDFTAEFAFNLLTVAGTLERIADHCTNICEQVIYLESGLIVRHLPGGWSKPERPSI